MVVECEWECKVCGRWGFFVRESLELFDATRLSALDLAESGVGPCTALISGACGTERNELRLLPRVFRFLHSERFN
jgi:hypothetical protein